MELRIAFLTQRFDFKLNYLLIPLKEFSNFYNFGTEFLITSIIIIEI